MIFHNPIWLLLLVPMGVVVWGWKMPSRSMQLLRGAMVVLIILTMSRPALKLPSRAGTVVIVADRSSSMPADNEERLTEAVSIVEREMSRQDQLGVVSFGERVAIDKRCESGEFLGFESQVGGNGSDLARAIDY